MAKYEERLKANRQNLIEYVSEHIEVKELAEMIMKLSDCKCRISISLGDKKADWFQSYMSNELHSARVIISEYKGIPQIIFRDLKDNSGACTLSLDLVSDIEFSCSDNSYQCICKYEDRFDYRISATII